jgi:hypothetical protein
MIFFKFKKIFLLPFALIIVLGCDALKFRAKNKIIVSGNVKFLPDGDFIEGASIGVKGTKLFCLSDKNGNYSFDLTSVADTSNNITLLATYVTCRLKVILINYKLREPIKIDIGLQQGELHDHDNLILEK